MKFLIPLLCFLYLVLASPDTDLVMSEEETGNNGHLMTSNLYRQLRRPGKPVKPGKPILKPPGGGKPNPPGGRPGGKPGRWWDPERHHHMDSRVRWSSYGQQGPYSQGPYYPQHGPYYGYYSAYSQITGKVGILDAIGESFRNMIDAAFEMEKEVATAPKDKKYRLSKQLESVKSGLQLFSYPAIHENTPDWILDPVKDASKIAQYQKHQAKLDAIEEKVEKLKDDVTEGNKKDLDAECKSYSQKSVLDQLFSLVPLFIESRPEGDDFDKFGAAILSETIRAATLAQICGHLTAEKWKANEKAIQDKVEAKKLFGQLSRIFLHP